MKTYELVCPVCGVAHEKKYDFFASPRSLLSSDGRILPAASCGDHTAEELRAVMR